MTVGRGCAAVPLSFRKGRDAMAINQNTPHWVEKMRRFQPYQLLSHQNPQIPNLSLKYSQYFVKNSGIFQRLRSAFKNVTS
ncbi:hypothetical protein EGR_07592 [Echinococcus granulosus]|uniref:Uncharacterized protein n=1 Tax=Echinococcus granulosus TaxID=6210 RepID=W6UAL7_ECHGR|nr:hypothetical protein EGR_07592 [Echinococcus granulosus]EUB57581.1 hypothetical protein EGR_07592 [Echinococcus granulosus]